MEISLRGMEKAEKINPVKSQYWYVYLLLSKKTNQWYIGLTKDLQKRILSHNAAENRSTKWSAVENDLLRN